MYDKDFAELVKIAAEKLKEDTVYKMLTRSEDYQKESDERDKAERNYEQLDLTMEQRKVCDVFLDYRDRQSLHYLLMCKVLRLLQRWRMFITHTNGKIN